MDLGNRARLTAYSHSAKPVFLVSDIAGEEQALPESLARTGSALQCWMYLGQQAVDTVAPIRFPQIGAVIMLGLAG